MNKPMTALDVRRIRMRGLNPPVGAKHYSSVKLACLVRRFNTARKEMDGIDKMIKEMADTELVWVPIHCDVSPASTMVVCSEQFCPLRRECANHITAGDFRTEDGLTPDLRLIDGKWCCTKKIDPDHDYGALMINGEVGGGDDRK